MGLIVTFIVEKESPAGSRFVTTLEASFLVVSAWGKRLQEANSCLLREKRSALVNSVTVLSLTEGLIGVSQMRILSGAPRSKGKKESKF